jgi:hypothetical protein
MLDPGLVLHFSVLCFCKKEEKKPNKGVKNCFPEVDWMLLLLVPMPRLPGLLGAIKSSFKISGCTLCASYVLVIS